MKSTSGLSIWPRNCLAYADSDSTYRRCPSAKIVSKARLDFPEPDSPVKTINASLGRSSDTSFRLCSRAPRTIRRSATAVPVLLTTHRCSVMVSTGGDKAGGFCGVAGSRRPVISAPGPGPVFRDLILGARPGRTGNVRPPGHHSLMTSVTRRREEQAAAVRESRRTGLPGFLHRRVDGLPGPFWVLWSGTLVNRIGLLVEPFLAFYLSAQGLSLGAIGVALAMSGAGSILSQLIGGALADRIGRRA